MRRLVSFSFGSWPKRRTLVATLLEMHDMKPIIATTTVVTMASESPLGWERHLLSVHRIQNGERVKMNEHGSLGIHDVHLW